MLTRGRGRSVAVSVAVVAASAVAVASGSAAASGRTDTGTSYVAVTHQVGSTYYAAGNTSDSVLGSGSVTYNINAGTGTKPGTIKITAKKVTEFTSTGSLYGSAAGTRNDLGRRVGHAHGDTQPRARKRRSEGTQLSSASSREPARLPWGRLCFTPRASSASRRQAAAAAAGQQACRRRAGAAHGAAPAAVPVRNTSRSNQWR